MRANRRAVSRPSDGSPGQVGVATGVFQGVTEAPGVDGGDGGMAMPVGGGVTVRCPHDSATSNRRVRTSAATCLFPLKDETASRSPDYSLVQR